MKNPDRYKQAEALFNAALTLPSARRPAFLEAACASDQELRAEVESLLAAHEHAGSFIDHPPVEAATRILAKEEADDEAGRMIGHYRVQRLLGKGGMGEVYLAQDTKLDRAVALKLLPARFTQDSNLVRRFVQEAKSASALNHPNIITIYEIGQEEGTHFIATEYVEGKTLRQILRTTRLSLNSVLDAATQIANALATAHAAGIVHRDIKPENIMLRPDGLVKLLDFGLAKLITTQPVLSDSQAETQAKGITTPGVIVGTVHYMSPEQARGLQVDARTDIFSLGVVLYEMLARKTPFTGETMTDVLAAILEREPPPLYDCAPEVTIGLEEIISKALHKDRAERYQSAKELLAELNMVRKDLESVISHYRTSSTKQLKAQTTVPSIAVMPLADLSPQRDQEYFCEGMAEEVINALAQIEGLRVVSRGSSFRFKGTGYDIREIGEKLHVTSVLEGSVRRAGNRLRIAAQLINVDDGFQVWSERYDCEMKDVFDIQDEISRAIVQALKLKLIGNQQQQLVRRYTDNVEAYQLYLKGRYHWNRRVPGSVGKAMEFFKQALDEDPNFAPAYAGLADCYILPGYYAMASPKDVMPLGKAAALRALEIDPNLAEAHASLGAIAALYEFNWPEAEAYFRRALEENSNYSIARYWYGIFALAPQGRLEQALSESKKGRELDPLSPAPSSAVGMMICYQRNYDAAVKELHRTLDLDPNFAVGNLYLGKIYCEQGRTEEGIAVLQKAREVMGDSPVIIGVLGYYLAASGDREGAQNLLDHLKNLASQKYVPAQPLALIYSGLGHDDLAFEWLDKAYDEQSSLLIWLKVDPTFDKLRSDPRCTLLLRKMGLDN
jgi:serine/threonine-protein kinase